MAERPKPEEGSMDLEKKIAEMVNGEGFRRDATLLLECKHLSDWTDAEFSAHVRELAHDYGIGDAEVWDLLPEIEKGPYFNGGKE
jgi:hypothetical protein